MYLKWFQHFFKISCTMILTLTPRLHFSINLMQIFTKFTKVEVHQAISTLPSLKLHYKQIETTPLTKYVLRNLTVAGILKKKWVSLKKKKYLTKLFRYILTYLMCTYHLNIYIFNTTFKLSDQFAFNGI